MTETKNHPPAGGEEKQKDEKQKQVELIKNKINGFLINYFNYLIFALAAVILAAGLFILAYPKYQQISKENEEAKNNLQIEYETKFNYLNSLKNLKASYQSISGEDKAKIAGMLPVGRETSVIITDIESIAVRNSAILTSVKIEPPVAGGRTNLKVEQRENKEPPAGIFNQPPPGIGLIKMEVNLGSVNYPILKNIIKAFENNLKLYDVSQINFNASEDTALLTVYSYYLQ